MQYTLNAYMNNESHSPYEAKERGANWEIGDFSSDVAITLSDVQGTGSDMTVFDARVDTAMGMCEMFGETDTVALYVADEKGIALFVDKGDGWEECIQLESDSEDDESEEKKCPECGGVMKFAMLPDSVGDGVHEGHECSDCHYND